MLKLFKNKSFWVILVLVVALLVVMKISASSRQEVTGIERLIHDAFTPVQTGLDRSKQAFGALGTGLAEKRVLIDQNKALQVKNNSLSLENQQLREYRAEVARLRKILDFREQTKDIYTMQAARVIARSPSNWTQTIVLDKGSDDGIKAGMCVISPEGLVGRVVSVSSNSAQVWLITDREMAVGVVLQETRETRGIVEGLGESNKLHMINIPYYSKIRQGQRVITSGLSENYPKGILLGRVKKVEREKNGLLLSAVVEPVVDFDKLEEVLVITDYDPQAIENAEKAAREKTPPAKEGE